MITLTIAEAAVSLNHRLKKGVAAQGAGFLIHKKGQRTGSLSHMLSFANCGIMYLSPISLYEHLSMDCSIKHSILFNAAY